MSPLDLHVLSTPPAFVLSQDQTLSFNPVYFLPVFPAKNQLIRNYCLFFAFLVLYRFQGSVPDCAFAPCDSLILSDFQKKVNTFFQLFLHFGQSFSFPEQDYQKLLRSFPDLSVHSHLFHFRLFVVLGRRREYSDNTKADGQPSHPSA